MDVEVEHLPVYTCISYIVAKECNLLGSILPRFIINDILISIKIKQRGRKEKKRKKKRRKIIISLTVTISLISW